MSLEAAVNDLLSYIRPDNETLVDRWANALGQVDGLYQEVGATARHSMARENALLLGAALDAGSVHPTTARKFADSPIYLRQPMAEFLEAVLMVNEAVREYVFEIAPEPEVGRLAMKQIHAVLAAGAVRIVQLREARESISSMVAIVGKILRETVDAREAAGAALAKIVAGLNTDLAVVTQLTEHDMRLFASSQPMSSLGIDPNHVWTREELPNIALIDRRESISRPLDSSVSGPEGILTQHGFTYSIARPLFVKGVVTGTLILLYRKAPRPDEVPDEALACVEPLLAAHLGFASQTSALGEADAAIRELFDASPSMLVALDRGGRLLRANNRFIERIGIREGLIGMPLSWLVHPSWLDRFQDLWHEIDTSTLVEGARVDLLTTASIRLPVVLEAHWLETTGGMCMIAMTDVSEQVQRQAEAEQKVDDLTAFAHHVAHDLRHPLRTIAGFSAMMIEDIKADPDAAVAHARRIIDAAKRGNELITGLLAYARTPSRQHKPAEVSLSSMVELAREAFEISLGQGECILVADLEPDPHFLGDPTALQALLDNLIANAIQHGGRNPVTIEVSTQSAGPGWAELRVRDDGVGISDHDQERIFDVFVRGSSRSPGSGVGLAIVRRIAEAHGGRVSVESDAGAGSLFRVHLPAA